MRENFKNVKKPKGVPESARLVRMADVNFLKTVNPLLKGHGIRVRTKAYASGGGCPTWVWVESVGEKVLEEFNGFVEKFDGELAYVRLTDSEGEVFAGDYPVSAFRKAGIREHRRFKLRTVEAGMGVRMDLEAIPDKELTDADYVRIDEKLKFLDEGREQDDYPTK